MGLSIIYADMCTGKKLHSRVSPRGLHWERESQMHKTKGFYSELSALKLPAAVPRVWSNIGPVLYEAVTPWFLVQSNSSSFNCVH